MIGSNHISVVLLAEMFYMEKGRTDSFTLRFTLAMFDLIVNLWETRNFKERMTSKIATQTYKLAIYHSHN